MAFLFIKRDIVKGLWKSFEWSTAFMRSWANKCFIMALIYAPMVNYRCLQNRSQAWFAQELHHRPSKIYHLSRTNHLRVAYLIQYLEKWRRSLWCRSRRVEATTNTMCHGKLNCCPINSVYSFKLKVPARQINAKHTLRLLLRTVKISTNKIIYWLYRNLKG